MLPRLAAMVWSTTRGARYSVRPISPSTRTANGTKVMSATSLVTTMDTKKGSSTRARLTRRIRRSPASNRWASTAKTPHSCSPATTAIRQNRRVSTRQSI